jgi:hypothetical protein
MMRLRAVLRVVAINVLVLLGCALLIELVFGEWFGGDGLATLNVQRNIEIRYSAAGLYPGAGEVIYRRDRFGLRGPYGGDPAKIELLTLGGSTTNQIYLPEEQGWQAKMAEAFALLGRKLVWASAAIDGQSTRGHIEALDLWLPKIPGLKPKWALAYIGLNDLLVDGSSNADALKRFPSVQHHIRRKSALYRLGRTASGWLAANRGRMVHQKTDFASLQWTTAPSREDWAAERAQALAAYDARLDELIDRIRALGAQPILVTQTRGDWRKRPEGVMEGAVHGKGEPNGLDVQMLLALFNARTLAACQRKGALCVDLAGKLEFKPDDFYDFLHNTPQGALKVGRFLADELKDVLR